MQCQGRSTGLLPIVYCTALASLVGGPHWIRAAAVTVCLASTWRTDQWVTALAAACSSPAGSQSTDRSASTMAMAMAWVAAAAHSMLGWGWGGGRTSTGRSLPVCHCFPVLLAVREACHWLLLGLAAPPAASRRRQPSLPAALRPAAAAAAPGDALAEAGSLRRPDAGSLRAEAQSEAGPGWLTVTFPGDGF